MVNHEGPTLPVRSTPPPSEEIISDRPGYVLQAGAFSELNRAVRLTEKLQENGLDAFYLLQDPGSYVVQFGDFPSYEEAFDLAKELCRRGIIDDFYIFRPEREIDENDPARAEAHLRASIIRTAKGFIGAPYRWGGSSKKRGFDCSGLTSAVYRLNGVRLPRSSRGQWKAGRPVKRSELLEGDLVFFATAGGKRISHVGIYVGDGKFIHAPRRGRKIRIDLLSNSYFERRYAGAKRYL